MQGDAVVLPEGSELHGKVTSSIISGKTKGRDQLDFRFGTITVRGQDYASLSSVAIQANPEKGRTRK
jgi:hypothetical protein